MAKSCYVRSSINIDEYLTVDHIVEPGETISSHDYTRRPGGKGANGAVAIAKAGAKVDFSGMLGSDGTWLKDTLKAFNINVDSLGTSPKLSTGRAIIQVCSTTAENSIVLVSGANHAPEDQWPPLELDEHKHSHVLLQNEIPLLQTCLTLRTSKNRSITTVFNPSPLPTPSEIKKQIDWTTVDWLVVNEEEASSLARVDRSRSVQFRNQLELVSDSKLIYGDVLVSLIRSAFANQGVVITLGSEGCLVGYHSRPGQWYTFHSPASTGTRPVLDTTGAGDCFTGFLIAQLMQTEKLSVEAVKNAVKIAGKAARLCVEQKGTIDSYPVISQVVPS